jgi:two-component system sensor histidine kinase PilS (NtrC family)
MLREELEYDSDRDRLMRIIFREADRLAVLVTNFLLFAKPPAGRVLKIELDRALTETVELFEKDASCRGRISVDKVLFPGVWVEMDPTHLRQILWNLLVNAAEAIDGAGHIRIELDDIRQRHVRIRIVDDGCGMSPEVLRSIFDPFFTTKSSGTGLGLSIVHRILESYDSWLDTQSRVGSGTTFTLRIRQCPPP